MHISGTDYYSPQPTIKLRKPLAITGYPGLKFRTLTYELAAITGVSLVDVDRWVEHQAGKSLRKIILDDGIEIARGMESKLLRKCLNLRPPQFVVFADQVLLEDDNLKLVGTAAHLIYFHASRTKLFWSIRHHSRGHAGLPCASLPVPLQRPEQLDTFLAARESAMLAAKRRIALEHDPDQNSLEELMYAVQKLCCKE